MLARIPVCRGSPDCRRFIADGNGAYDESGSRSACVLHPCQRSPTSSPRWTSARTPCFTAAMPARDCFLRPSSCGTNRLHGSRPAVCEVLLINCPDAFAAAIPSGKAGQDAYYGLPVNHCSTSRAICSSPCISPVRAARVIWAADPAHRRTKADQIPAKRYDLHPGSLPTCTTEEQAEIRNRQ